MLVRVAVIGKGVEPSFLNKFSVQTVKCSSCGGTGTGLMIDEFGAKTCKCDRCIDGLTFRLIPKNIKA